MCCKKNDNCCGNNEINSCSCSNKTIDLSKFESIVNDCECATIIPSLKDPSIEPQVICSNKNCSCLKK